MIAVTGASGQLGRLVIESLKSKTAPSEIIAIVRNPEKIADYSEAGITVRKADYTDALVWPEVLQGVDKLLLISSSEVGKRAPQHANVIAGAQKAGVKLIAYTSILHADTSPLPLRLEHLETEKMLKDSGIPYVLLRNGWYTENYAASIPSALEHGALFGAAENGRISSAARADYAAAAAEVLTAQDQAGKIYELAGDTNYTLAEFAGEIAKQSGKEISYTNMGKDEYMSLLVQVGLPEPVAQLLAESDNGAARGGLFDDSKTLSRLIGRPTTPASATIDEWLKNS